MGAECRTTSDWFESELELLDVSAKDGMKVFVLLTAMFSFPHRGLTKTHYLSSKAQVISAKAWSQPWLTLY
jgi:hypothetical protein